MIKFGVSVYGVSRKIESGEMTPEQAVTWLTEQGAEVIEIVPFGIDLLGDPGLAERLRRAAGDVPIENYSLNANFLRLTADEYDAEVARVKKHIDAARGLGIRTFRLDCAAYRRPPEFNAIEIFQEELPAIIQTYEQICAYAAPYNITILLENHGFHVNGGDRVRQVLKGVTADNFGHQLDVGNYTCVDELPEITTRKMLPFAKTIHMKDFYIRGGDRDPGDTTQFDCSGSWFRSSGGRYLRGSILGQGDIDIPGILRDIKKAGFTGPVYVEYEGMEDCFYGVKVSLDNLKRLYAEA